MSDEIRTAFSHPSERAIATAGDAPLDRISVADFERSVDIGAFQQERGALQTLRFNLVVEVQTAADLNADDVDQILSYDALTEAIDVELAAERLNLLETLAARIAARILAHPLAARCFLRIEKLDRGPFVLGVEIVRSAAQAPQISTKVPHPVIAYLSNAAIARDDLPGLLTQLAAQGGPLILCVGAGADPIPRAEQALSQARIDLLAIEQNAWVLASRDSRCVVVQTRTELDWAMKHARISVWAPSKLVLDSFDSPDLADRTGEGLAVWLAENFVARELVAVGGTLPKSTTIRTTQLSATEMPFAGSPI